ncbi:diguanylate cyclase [Marinomonas sp. C2222]|uniref:Diguanylate cyclase n=1 Tax=Marinomonas sargassi TaxID=2984494 RepID=A0ABT2YPH9_9GAMM|nr:diguanylate cyclase [Marinomonas sargassi]MCV2401787.1 diguanylate cyclase [Marinomonas sargassi]
MTKFSLRSVLIFPYVTLVICLALAIGLLSYQTGSYAVQTVSTHLLKETVSRLSQAIDRHVVGSVSALETAFPAGITTPTDIQTDFDGIRTRLWTASSLYLDPNNYVYYGNKSGQAIGLYRDSLNSGELRVKFTPEEHRTFYKLDGINGEPIFASVEEKNFEPRVRPWFQAAWDSLDDIWTSVYIDFGTQDLVATRARRIQGEDGELEGVVATDMSLKSLNTFVSTLNISENAIAFIIEPNGMLIASSHSANIKRDENGAKSRVFAHESENFLLADVYQHIKPLLSDNLESLEPQTINYKDQNNKSIYIGYNIFEDEAGLKWINIVAMPSEDFMGGIKHNVLQTVLIGIFATAFVTIIGLLVLQWVTKDIKLLSKAVNKVGSGFLEKPIYIQRKDEIGDLAKNFSDMQKRLQTDYLTRIPNRYAFEQHLQATITKDITTNTITPFVVLFFDLNDFKNINDLFGHETGDIVLREFAFRLKNTISQGDIAARYAGDEFVVMLNNIKDKEEVEPIVLEMEKVLEQPIKLQDGEELNLRTAIGAAYYPADSDNIEQLLNIADTVMYVNKTTMKMAQ